MSHSFSNTRLVMHEFLYFFYLKRIHISSWQIFILESTLLYTLLLYYRPYFLLQKMLGLVLWERLYIAELGIGTQKTCPVIFTRTRNFLSILKPPLKGRLQVAQRFELKFLISLSAILVFVGFFFLSNMILLLIHVFQTKGTNSTHFKSKIAIQNCRIFRVFVR